MLLVLLHASDEEENGVSRMVNMDKCVFSKFINRIDI